MQELFKNDGQRIQQVSKRVIWDAIKNDPLLVALVTEFKPKMIEKDKMLWKK